MGKKRIAGDQRQVTIFYNKKIVGNIVGLSFISIELGSQVCSFENM